MWLTLKCVEKLYFIVKFDHKVTVKHYFRCAYPRDAGDDDPPSCRSSAILADINYDGATASSGKSSHLSTQRFQAKLSSICRLQAQG